MKTYQFKTSINCGNCVKSVTNFLNEVENLNKWEVNTTIADKILTVEGSERLTAAAVIEAVEDAGFDIRLANLEAY